MGLGGFQRNPRADARTRRALGLLSGTTLWVHGGTIEINDQGQLDIADGGITTAKLADDAVTFPKMQEIATDSLIGRDTAGAGNPENITLNATLSMTGAGLLQRAALTGDVTASAGSNATTIANDAVSDAKLRNSAALSVIGRSLNSTGDPADISAGSNDRVLSRISDALAFTQLTVGMFPNSVVTLAKIANAAANDKLLGSGNSGSGAAYTEITLGSGLTMTGTTLSASGGGGGGLSDGDYGGVIVSGGGTVMSVVPDFGEDFLVCGGLTAGATPTVTLFHGDDAVAVRAAVAGFRGQEYPNNDGGDPVLATTDDININDEEIAGITDWVVGELILLATGDTAIDGPYEITSLGETGVSPIVLTRTADTLTNGLVVADSENGEFYVLYNGSFAFSTQYGLLVESVVVGGILAVVGGMSVNQLLVTGALNCTQLNPFGVSLIRVGGMKIANTSEPDDSDLDSEELTFWFDPTDMAPKLMIKAKSADGTVVTGEVALT